MNADPLARLWPRPQRLLRRGRDWNPAVAPRVRIVAGSDLRPSGYRLRAAGEEVLIDAPDDAGARHAARTLAQVLRLHATQPSIPGIEIEDWPDFPRRGVLLDVSRGRVPREEHLFALVDWLARLKIDELQLYTEHTFAYRGHEEVWRGSSALTPQEIRALDSRCRARGVDLVPNQQSFGHMHRWLAHDRYRPLAEVPEGLDHAFSTRREPFSLCPTDPACVEFLGGLYDQLLPCFRSRLFAVGLDETFDLGLGRSRATCEARGKGRVYLEFLREIHRLARERGRRIQFWADGILQHPELLGEVPRDAIALAWGYEADPPFAAETRVLAGSGLEFYVCPGTSSWQSLAGRTANARSNLATAARCGREAGASGYLITDWGDRGHLQPPFASLPGFLLGAGFAWNASSADDPDLDLASLLDAHAFRDAAGVLGRAAVDLGNAYLEAACPSTNGSALFFLLAFASEPLPHDRMPGLSIEGLERSRRRLLESRTSLSRTLPRDPAAENSVSEMKWAADLLAWTCEFGIARLSGPEGAPVHALPPRERRRLARALRELSLEHRRLWALVARPGGLEESAAWLERVIDLLEPE